MTEDKEFNLKRSISKRKKFEKKEKKKIENQNFREKRTKEKLSELKKKNRSLQKENDILNKKIEDLENELKSLKKERKPRYKKLFEIGKKDDMKSLVKFNYERFKKIKKKITNCFKNLDKDGFPKIENRSKFPIKFSLFITLFWLKHYFIERIIYIFFEIPKRLISEEFFKRHFCTINKCYSNRLN